MKSNKHFQKINLNEIKSFTTFFNEVKQIFHTNDSKDFKGASKDNIKEFESLNKVMLSNNLKAYFEIINGTNGGLFLSNLIPLNNLKPIFDYHWFSDREFNQAEIIKYNKTYVFGDIMINSHQWAIVLNERGEEEPIIELGNDSVVAKNIVDFLTIFINESPYSLVG